MDTSSCIFEVDSLFFPWTFPSNLGQISTIFHTPGALKFVLAKQMMNATNPSPPTPGWGEENLQRRLQGEDHEAARFCYHLTMIHENFSWLFPNNNYSARHIKPPYQLNTDPAGDIKPAYHPQDGNGHHCFPTGHAGTLDVPSITMRLCGSVRTLWPRRA